jgi:hypothetical protein
MGLSERIYFFHRFESSKLVQIWHIRSTMSFTLCDVSSIFQAVISLCRLSQNNVLRFRGILLVLDLKIFQLCTSNCTSNFRGYEWQGGAHGCNATENSHIRLRSKLGSMLAFNLYYVLSWRAYWGCFFSSCEIHIPATRLNGLLLINLFFW